MRSDFSKSVFEFILGASLPCRILSEDKSEDSGLDTLLRDAESFARQFRAAGARPGEPIVLILAHGRAYAAALLATRLSETLGVLVNPTLKEYELSHIIEDSGAGLILVDRETYLNARSDAIVSHAVAGARLVQINNRRTPSTIAGARLVIYTSGSTGRPKGCVLTEAGISASVWAVIEYLGLTQSDSTVVYTPPGYVYALSQTLTHLVAGSRIVSYGGGMMHPGHLLKTIGAHSVTGVATNPTGLRLMLDHAHSAAALNHVRYVMTGGQPLNGSLVARARQLFPRAQVINTYGCTETSSRISCFVCPIGVEGITPPIPVGFPITGTRVRIVDDRGREVTEGEEGEVLVRGPSLMGEYWRAPELTRERIDSGWFRTRDRGRYDDKRGLTLLGRIDVTFMVGHEKVGPEEVEAVLEGVPGVSEAAVSIEPDDVLEAHLVAVIVAADPVAVERACRRRCLELLAPHKGPRRYVFRSAIPHTLYGKIDRQALARAINEDTDA